MVAGERGEEREGERRVGERERRRERERREREGERERGREREEERGRERERENKCISTIKYTLYICYDKLKSLAYPGLKNTHM